MSDLQYELPEDFEPVFCRDQNPAKDVTYFVKTSDGFKDYIDASPEDIFLDAKQICGSNAADDPRSLRLLQNRTIELDRAISIAISKSVELFGGQEFWESQPDWERASKLVEQGKK